MPPLDESIYKEGAWPEMSSAEYRKKAADKAEEGSAGSSSALEGSSGSEVS